MPILVPSALNLHQALRLTANMRGSLDGQIQIDCADLGWVEPFGMVLAICCADHLRREGRSVVAINVPDDSYARHMGFFNNLDPTVEPPKSPSRSSENYIAIVRRSKNWFEDEALARGLSSAQDFIYEYAKSFAELLTQTSDESATNRTLQFCLAEVLRNIYEHAQSDQIIVCGQYWKTLNRVDLAVADEGIGLTASLSENPFLKIRNDADAIHMAMLPGVSGRSYEGSPRRLDTRTEWENSGYGLWLSSQMSRAIGSFTISSGNVCLYFRQTTMQLRSSHRGTILGFSFDPTKVQPFRESMLGLRSSGQAIAKKMKGLTIDASAASIAIKMGD